MKQILGYLFVSGVLMASTSAWGQSHEAKPGEASAHEKSLPVHSLAITIGHAHISEGRDADGNPKALTAPLWGFDYNLHFARKWMVGLHTDLIVENYEVVKRLETGGEEEIVERKTPVAPALMGFYLPNHHWAIGFGVGGEFAEGEDYLLNRISLEYGAPMNKGWEVFGVVQYDIRWQAYDTWTISLGIAKLFGKGARKE